MKKGLIEKYEMMQHKAHSQNFELWIFRLNTRRLCDNILLKKKQFEINFLNDNYKSSDKNSIKKILYYSLESKVSDDERKEREIKPFRCPFHAEMFDRYTFLPTYQTARFPFARYLYADRSWCRVNRGKRTYVSTSSPVDIHVFIASNITGFVLAPQVAALIQHRSVCKT